MRRRGRVLPVTAAISALLMTAVYGASLETARRSSRDAKTR